MIERGECDFVIDIAAELPTQAIADIMGVPMEDRHQLRDWSNHMTGSEDPEFNISTRTTGRGRGREMWTYAECAGRREAREPARRHHQRARPRRDRVDGEKHQLSELEFDVFFMLLAVAGTETTRNVIGARHAGVLRAPRTVAAAGGDPTLLDTAVEEMIRWVTPVMYFRRTATRDHELDGEQIAAGDKVVIWYMLGEPRRGRVRRPLHVRHHPLRRTSTSRSAAAGPTSASAPTSPAWRSG